jgi:indole-3-glycerol phosphate synthase
MTENFLKNMAKESFKRFQVAANSLAEKDLLSLCEGTEVLEPIDLPSNDFHIITEIKKQSPSMGRLAPESFDVKQQAMSYIEGGASLLSVLTEPSRFLGGLEDLQLVANLEHRIPVMRKDLQQAVNPPVLPKILMAQLTPTANWLLPRCSS